MTVVETADSRERPSWGVPGPALQVPALFLFLSTPQLLQVDMRIHAPRGCIERAGENDRPNQTDPDIYRNHL